MSHRLSYGHCQARQSVLSKQTQRNILIKKRMKKNQPHTLHVREYQPLLQTSNLGRHFLAASLGILLLCSPDVALSHNTIFLANGTLAGQSVSKENYQITVRPGAPVQGNFSVNIHNEMPPTAIAPVASTPTWGAPSASFSCLASSVATGDSTLDVPVNLTAPSTPGTYYMVVAMAGTYNCDQIMSGTHPGWPADWINGNKVALLPQTEFEKGTTNGWIQFSWYTPNGPQVGEMAMTAVRVVVSQPSISLVKAIRPSFTALSVGAVYQLQSSTDMTAWKDEGVPFTATNSSMAYPNYWDVDNWTRLFFRLKN